MTSKAERDFLKLARARFKQAEDADLKQRERELLALRFYAGDQWPQEVKDARAGINAGAQTGQPPVPARPCLTINKTREPVRQVLNQERQADMGIEIVPADDFAELEQPVTDTEIDLREGLVRRIQRTSHAEDARTWAFSRATIAGRGYYGVMTRYVETEAPGPAQFDQEVFIKRYYNQSSVSLDPAHEQPDGSDAEWGFEATDLRWDDYKAQCPNGKDGKTNPLLDVSSAEWRALGDDMPGWFSGVDEGEDQRLRMVRVVNYWYTEQVSEKIALLPDGRVVSFKDMPAGVAAIATRDKVTKTVKWAKLDGSQVLDETDWPGRYIPIVKVLGEELHPYDSERRAQGMVEPAMDSCKAFNYMVTAEVEAIGLGNTGAPELDPEQIETFEAWWEQRTVRKLPYLPRRSRDSMGRDFLPINWNFPEPPIQAIAVSINMLDQAIQSTTGVADPSLGKIDPTLRSGKAIKALQEQAQRGTSNYLDNLRRSIEYEARIINDLLYPVYGTRPGRIARIVTGEGKNDSQPVMIGKPFVMQGQGARAVPVAHDPTKSAGPPKHYTLTKDANFNVAVKVTKAWDTRREQESAVLGDLISAEPQLMGWFGDLFFENQDGPGHKQMAERAKLMLAPPIQAALSGQQPLPPEVQQQLAQAQAMTEAVGQKAAELQRLVDGKVVEKQAEVEKARIDADAKVEIAKINEQAAVYTAELKAGLTDMQTRMAYLENQMSLAHEHAMQKEDHAHEQHLAEQAHAQALEQGQQGHQQALEQGVQEAALQPPPSEGAGA